MRNNKQLTILIIAACTILSGVLAYIGYNDGVTRGNIEGYTDGYWERSKEYEGIGYNAGVESGYHVGTPIGYRDGFDEGWDLAEKQSVSALSPNNPLATDPTYSQLIQFLSNDKTEDLDYSDDFNCWGFALMLRRNAERQGIKCAIVSMTYEDKISGEKTSGHVINMFTVVDQPKGWVWRSDGSLIFRSGDPVVYVDAQYGRPMYDIKKGGSYQWYFDFSEFRYNDSNYMGSFDYINLSELHYKDSRYIGDEKIYSRAIYCGQG
jgi:hypothetical protein